MRLLELQSRMRNALKDISFKLVILFTAVVVT